MYETAAASQLEHSSNTASLEAAFNTSTMSCDFALEKCDVDPMCHTNSVTNQPSTFSSPNSTGSKHLISIDSLVINKELGAGEFGVVQQGVWTNEETGERTQVAIKCLSKQRMQNNSIEFLKEAAMMHSIDHEYIVRLYGVVMDSQNLMLVTELAPLRSLLECLKESTIKSSFPVISLCDFSSQIADGMSYLELKRLIHRDLAARNILVFARNKIKISDFGLSRALGVGKDYYQTNFNVNLKLPIAWCAPECINFLKFTSASDVWAYGVTLWEMFSYGFQPWAALTGQQILQAIDAPNYQRLEQPDSCPKEYYSLMLKCWEHEPSERPRFHDIVKMLPDCRPELVQVVKNCPNDTSSRKDHLIYKVGDVITVLEKYPQRHMSIKSNCSSSADDTIYSSDGRALWKGSLVSGKTGLFDPSNTVTHLGSLFPPVAVSNIVASSSSHSATASSHGSSNGHGSCGPSQLSSHHIASSTSSSNPLSANFLRGIVEKISTASLTSGIYSSKRKLKRDMISMPQSDFKHTGHVGVDGAFFGDVSFLGEKYSQLQQPHKSSGVGGSTGPAASILARSSSDASDRAPLLHSHREPLDSRYHAAHPIFSGNLSLKDLKSRPTSMPSNAPGDHEYHEIVNDTDNNDLLFLESPHFETIDFGPSLLDEVCRELDIISKPSDCDFNDHQQELINECSSNVKNEIKEIVSKFPLLKNEGKKKQATVKPISADDEESLDSAIAMAKELASRSILEYDGRLDNAAFECPSSADSPKTPNSPNKKSSKFSFKFHSKSSPKTEKRSFSEEAERMSSLQSIISREAKEAYSSLIEKKSSVNSRSNSSTLINVSSLITPNDSSQSCINQALTHLPYASNVKPVATVIANTSSMGQFAPSMISQPTATKVPSSVQHIRAKSEDATCNRNEEAEMNDSNPLRMLRAGGVTAFSKVRGNKQRLSSSLRVTGAASSIARSSLGTPPPVPTLSSNSTNQIDLSGSAGESLDSVTVSDQSGHLANALPLPPRDRTTALKIPLKHHQRKHPLLLSSSGQVDSADVVTITSGNSAASPQYMPVLSTFRPPPVAKQVSCPEPPGNYVSQVTISNGSNAADAPISANGSTKSQFTRMPIPPPPKPVRDPTTVLSSVEHSSSESLESQIAKGIKSLGLGDPEAWKAVTGQSNATDVPPKNDENDAAPDESENNKVSNINALNNNNNNNNNSSNNRSGSASLNSVDSDSVRVMQKVLQSEVAISAEECIELLSRTSWDVHNAIKCVRLKRMLQSHNVDITECDWIGKLQQSNWNVRQASNFLIATRGSSDGSTEV